MADILRLRLERTGHTGNADIMNDPGIPLTVFVVFESGYGGDLAPESDIMAMSPGVILTQVEQDAIQNPVFGIFNDCIEPIGQINRTYGDDFLKLFKPAYPVHEIAPVPVFIIRDIQENNRVPALRYRMDIGFGDTECFEFVELKGSNQSFTDIPIRVNDENLLP